MLFPCFSLLCCFPSVCTCWLFLSLFPAPPSNLFASVCTLVYDHWLFRIKDREFLDVYSTLNYTHNCYTSTIRHIDHPLVSVGEDSLQEPHHRKFQDMFTDFEYLILLIIQESLKPYSTLSWDYQLKKICIASVPSSNWKNITMQMEKMDLVWVFAPTWKCTVICMSNVLDSSLNETQNSVLFNTVHVL